MSKLPLLSWREVVKALGKVGFRIDRQKGSHIILVKDELIVPVPRHAEIKRRLLMDIITEAGPHQGGIPSTFLDRIVVSLSSSAHPLKRKIQLHNADEE